LPHAVSILTAAGEVEAARSFLEGVEVPPQWRTQKPLLVLSHAILEESEDHTEGAAARYREAADLLAGYGMWSDLGDALLGAGRCLLGLGKDKEAANKLKEALKVFTQLGARPRIKETKNWLERARAS
jgi:hypothetical protein